MRQREKAYTVRAHWDDDARVWYAESDDVPGLATGADTLEALVEKLKIVVPELLEENNLLGASESSDVPISILAERNELARRSA
jgi:predicted RNase H-like HicB family nuclease